MAAITGVVADASGAIIPGVEVTVTNVATDQSRTGVTNEVGRYYVPALNPGSYKIAAALAGFETTVRSGGSSEVRVRLLRPRRRRGRSSSG